MSYQALLHELLTWLMLAVPEGIMMVFTGLGSLGVRRPWKAVAAAGFAVGTASAGFRIILPGGFHAPVVLLVYAVLVVAVLKMSVKTAVLACFISAFLVNLGQVVVALPILKATGLSFAQTLTDPLLHLAFGWAGETVLVVDTVLVALKRGVIFTVPESRTWEDWPTSERGDMGAPRPPR